ncbi:unnamed protein product [Tilletia controversa]|uniref:Uncharacterized protein n=1 Tax=Tilletia controversa TaxID=13291 RepID=A0A8X7MVF7_9BASI|nr:hypothetical protein CF328_g5007 [Tilletia controversa]KAE8248779.1 hypothetical protein A4X06_0g3527 [Tilletia controversa]CAD6913160.1 unnamed protein product [Tilletia controversa]CAD6937905.1 unnamed protein product [Tilletia controversa]CAD6985729.1 unnamed protein product [Tilletia controversa]
MHVEGAVSPSGWALNGLLIRKVALQSISLWEKAQQEGSSEDRVSVRTKAINKVRKAANAMPNPHAPLPPHCKNPSPFEFESDLNAEEAQEIPLVQSLIENWPGTEEADFQMMANPKTRRSQPSDSECNQASAKRARIDPQSNETGAQGEVVVSWHTSAGPSALTAYRGPGDVDQTAVQAFFRLPELVLLVCTHLAYEKADLVVLSQVSKRVRVTVLPTLYSTVRVRLTKVGQLSQVLKDNPGLVEQIRYLNIWDDVAHYHARCNTANFRPMSKFRSQVIPRTTTATWSSFGHFLLAINNRKSSSTPLFELSFGQMNLLELYVQLRRAPRLIQTLTTFRIVNDLGATHFRGLTRKAVERTLRNHGTTMSEDLAVILRLICEIQDDSKVDNFRTFDFDALRLDTEERRSVLPMLPPRLLKTLAGRLHCLGLSVGDIIRADAEILQVLTEAHWPKLRGFQFYADGQSDEAYEIVQSSLTSFLHRHMHLVESDIRIHDDCSHEGRPHWANVTLPYLEACHIDLEKGSMEQLLDFADAHRDLRKLFVTGESDSNALASHQAVSKSLRFLRAEPEAAEEFLRAGAAIVHLDLDVSVGEYDEQRSRFPQCLHPDDRPTSSITGLNLAFFEISYTAIIEKSDRFLPLHQLPNLVELSLHLTLSAVDGTRDSPEQSAQCLAALLHKLAKHGNKLRAVAIQYDAAGDLPCDLNLAQAVHTFPPKLEYLTWHIPFSNHTDYYRVLRPQAILLPPSKQLVQSLQSPPSQSSSSTQTSEVQAKARLQRLPAIFRPKVDSKTGMWEDIDSDTYLNLFDHMGREPRLKCM